MTICITSGTYRSNPCIHCNRSSWWVRISDDWQAGRLDSRLFLSGPKFTDLCIYIYGLLFCDFLVLLRFMIVDRPLNMHIYECIHIYMTSNNCSACDWIHTCANRVVHVMDIFEWGSASNICSVCLSMQSMGRNACVQRYFPDTLLWCPYCRILPGEFPA